MCSEIEKKSLKKPTYVEAKNNEFMSFNNPILIELGDYRKTTASSLAFVVVVL